MSAAAHLPLTELDCLAASGDPATLRLARWHSEHPDGPQSPEEYAEDATVHRLFARRAAEPEQRHGRTVAT